MIGFILTLLTAIVASGFAAVIADGAQGEPVRVPTRDPADSPESGGSEDAGDSP